jgi:hypothetical protein
MFVNLERGGVSYIYGNEMWLAVSRRGAGGRGTEAARWPRVVVRGLFFCLVADWSQPYVILEAARQRGKEDLDGTPTTRSQDCIE